MDKNENNIIYLICREVIFNTMIKAKIDHIKYTVSTDSGGETLIQTMQTISIFFYYFPGHIPRCRCLPGPVKSTLLSSLM